MKAVLNIFYLCIALILSIEIEGVSTALEKKYLNTCDDVTVVDDFFSITDGLIVEIILPTLFQKNYLLNITNRKLFYYTESYFATPARDSIYSPPDLQVIS